MTCDERNKSVVPQIASQMSFLIFLSLTLFFLHLTQLKANHFADLFQGCVLVFAIAVVVVLFFTNLRWRRFGVDRVFARSTYYNTIWLWTEHM